MADTAGSVLVVDDEPMIVEFLELALEAVGYAVFAAGSSAAAGAHSPGHQDARNGWD
jgi:DNA-binding response OmpR family regulator